MSSFYIYLEAQRRWARSNERRRPHGANIRQATTVEKTLLVPPSEKPNSEVYRELVIKKKSFSRFEFKPVAGPRQHHRHNNLMRSKFLGRVPSRGVRPKDHGTTSEPWYRIEPKLKHARVTKPAGVTPKRIHKKQRFHWPHGKT